MLDLLKIYQVFLYFLLLKNNFCKRCNIKTFGLVLNGETRREVNMMVLLKELTISKQGNYLIF